MIANTKILFSAIHSQWDKKRNIDLTFQNVFLFIYFWKVWAQQAKLLFGGSVKLDFQLRTNTEHHSVWYNKSNFGLIVYFNSYREHGAEKSTSVKTGFYISARYKRFHEFHFL